MPIVIGILVAVIIYMEFDRRQMRERMLLQAAVPKSLGPVRTSPPLTAGEILDKTGQRRKIATVTIPT